MSQKAPSLLRGPFARAFTALAPASDHNRKLAALIANEERFVPSYFLSRMLFTPEQRRALLPDVNSSDTDRAEKPLRDSLRRAQSLDAINRVSYLESRCYMLNTLLRDSDSMSMAHGLEVRVPLIDHHLARQLINLPGSWKLNAGTPKPLLVHALRGELPDEIVHRPKRGFTLPFAHWLRGALRPAIEDAFAKIDDGPLGETVNATAARRVWQDFLQGKTSWSRPWALYVLQSWCRQHLGAG